MTLQKKIIKKSSKDSFHYKHLRKNQSKHYLKPYLPYIPILLLLCLGLITINLLSGRQKITTPNFNQNELLALTNYQRHLYNEKALVINPMLSKIAQQKINNNSFINLNKIKIKQNYAYGFQNSSNIITAWEAKSNSKNNLLNTNFSQVGYAFKEIKDNTGKSFKPLVVVIYSQNSNYLSRITFKVNNRINKSAPDSSITNFKDKLISRISIYSNGTIPSIVLIIISTILAIYLILRHLIFLKKLVLNGEKILLNNIWFDILIIIVILVAVYMTGAVGYIS